jgi:hypothetical protein
MKQETWDKIFLISMVSVIVFLITFFVLFTKQQNKFYDENEWVCKNCNQEVYNQYKTVCVASSWFGNRCESEARRYACDCKWIKKGNKQ